jgi:integrase
MRHRRGHVTVTGSRGHCGTDAWRPVRASAERPVLPGVFKRKEAGYLVRGRARDPLTGKRKETRLILTDTTDPAQAYALLQVELERIRSGATELCVNRPLFCDYAVSLLERKIVTGEIRSAAGRQKWGSILERHLIPAFGQLAFGELGRLHIEAWRTQQGERIRAGRLSPTSGNTQLAVLRVIVNTAVDELELERNPMVGVKPFDTSECETYSEEEPNALTPEEVPVFLEHMRQLFPQFFGVVALGLATGLRPSTLRPLRRKGDTPDVLWEQGVLLVRQPHSVGTHVMKTTKNKRRQRLSLPAELVDILRWHVERLRAGPMRDSDLLFPSRTGGFMSRSALANPFAKVTEVMKLAKHVTPRAMRRTFQDLARAAQVDDVVTRAVSGHVTEAMQLHYSTVNAEEMRQSLARVVSIAGFKQAQGAGR